MTRIRRQDIALAARADQAGTGDEQDGGENAHASILPHRNFRRQ
jgi:hypothetical protein